MRTVSLALVAHIGTLDPADKKPGSYEGSGVSVSLHPAVWGAIARIGHEGFLLRRQDGSDAVFLDALRLTSDERNAVLAWGRAHGLIEDREVWTASYYDVEDEARRSFECGSREEAVAELEELPRRRIRGPSTVVTATPALLAACSQTPSRHAAPSDLSFDLVLTLYAAEVPDIDGIWWREPLDPSRNSAPRGVILPSRLYGFETTPMSFAAVHSVSDVDGRNLVWSPPAPTVPTTVPPAPRAR